MKSSIHRKAFIYFGAVAALAVLFFFSLTGNDRSLKKGFDTLEIGSDVELVYDLMGKPKFHGGPDQDGVYYMYYPSRFRLTMYMIYVKDGSVVETDERILP